MTLTELILELYSESIVNKLVAKYKAQVPDLDDDTIKWYINRFDQVKAAPRIQQKDIFQYSYNELVAAVDSFQNSDKKKPEKPVKDNDIVYDKNNIVIFHSDTKEKCIKYGEGYEWCISAKENNLFATYRMSESEKTFYFVFNKNLPTDDPKHAIVIHRNAEGTMFSYSDADNMGDQDTDSWDEIIVEFPWLKGLDKLFRVTPLTPKERQRKDGLRVEDIKTISYDDMLGYFAFKMNEYHLTTGDFNKYRDAIIARFGNNGLAKLLNDLISSIDFDEVNTMINLWGIFKGFPKLEDRYYDRFVERDFEFLDGFYDSKLFMKNEDIPDRYVEHLALRAQVTPPGIIQLGGWLKMIQVAQTDDRIPVKTRQRYLRIIGEAADKLDQYTQATKLADLFLDEVESRVYYAEDIRDLIIEPLKQVTDEAIVYKVVQLYRNNLKVESGENLKYSMTFYDNTDIDSRGATHIDYNTDYLVHVLPRWCEDHPIDPILDWIEDLPSTGKYFKSGGKERILKAIERYT